MSADERAEVLNAINMAFAKKKMNYVVVGYEDNTDDGAFLEVLIDRKNEVEQDG